MARFHYCMRCKSFNQTDPDASMCDRCKRIETVAARVTEARRLRDASKLENHDARS
jgi:phage FluMu protein Com